MTGAAGLRDPKRIAQWWRWCWLIFGTIVVSRLAYLAWQGPKIASDSADYVTSARLLASQPSQWYVYVERGVNPSPLFSVLLAPFYTVSAAHALAMYLVLQAVLNGFIGLAVAWLVRQGWGDRAGLLAGLAVLVCPDFIVWSPYVLTDIPFAAFIAALGCQLVRTCQRQKPLRDGLLLALLVIVLLLLRREAVLLVLATPVALLWAMRGRRRVAAASLAGFAAPFLLVGAVLAAPYAFPNSPRLVGIDPSHVEAAALIPVWAGTQWTPAGRGTVGVDIQAPAELGARSDAELSQMLRDRILAFIEAHPVAFAKLAVLKAIYLWAPALPGWSKAHIASWALALSALDLLALVGLFAKPYRRGPREFSIMVLAVFTLTCMVTFTDFDQRYRLPASIGIVTLAGVGADGLLRRWPSELRVGRARRLGARQEPAGEDHHRADGQQDGEHHPAAALSRQ